MTLPIDKALRKAQNHIKAGELAEAEELYKQVLSKFPKDQKAIQGCQRLKVGLSTKYTVTSKTPEQIIQDLVTLQEHGQFKEVLSKLRRFLTT